LKKPLTRRASPQGLFYRLDIPTPWSGSPAPNTPILIWAGSTAVGLFTIQLAKLAGLRIATTASPRNHALLKSLGAEYVLHYDEDGVSEKLKAWAEPHGGFKHAFDTISEFGETRHEEGVKSYGHQLT